LKKTEGFTLIQNINIDDIEVLLFDLITYIQNEIDLGFILSEIDFHFKIFSYFENKFLQFNDNSWKIHNCFYLDKKKQYPDMVFFHQQTPLIVFELKYFGFNAPNKYGILKDISKIKGYFKTYSCSLVMGYSINCFDMDKEKFKDFQLELLNEINDRRLKCININLHDIHNYSVSKKKYNKYYESICSHLNDLNKKRIDQEK